MAVADLQLRIDYALCNRLSKLWHAWQAKKTRYHQFREVHVSDAISCPLRALLMRLFDVTPPCRALYFMKQGLEWEKDAIEAIKMTYRDARVQEERFIVTNLEHRGYRVENMTVIGTPDADVPSYSLLLEVKWTRFPRRSIPEILSRKQDIVTRAGGWRITWTFPTACFDLRIWPSWFLQMHGYSWLFRQLGDPREFFYIYANWRHQIDTADVTDYMERRYEDMWYRDLFLFAYVLDWYYRERYRFTPFHQLERVVWTELAGVYWLLWYYAGYYMRVEYQCRYCPFLWLRACPGLIPLRSFWWWSDDEIWILKRFAEFSDGVRDVLNRWGVLDEVLRAVTIDRLHAIRRNLASHHRDVAELIAAARRDVDEIFHARVTVAHIPLLY